MSLISLEFVVFFAALYCAYFLAGRFAPQKQWWVLLVGNVVFYLLAGSWQGLIYILVVAGTTWGVAQTIVRVDNLAKAERKTTKDRAERKAIKAKYAKKKRLLLIAGLIICLGILGYLKYWNVFLFNLGLAASTDSFGILLPLGISFYTFQSIMYMVDIYNGKYAPQGNFVRYLTFVSFFPQMVQGPINRYNELGPQLFESRRASLHQTRRGLWLLWYGVFKKIVIANMLSANIATIFSNVNTGIPGSVVLLGIVSYSIQEYADFSGGIDIVRGASEMLGIRMSLNFRQPYFSTSLSEFWRRWHMSLGVLMKDYVFYPLALTKSFQRLGKWGQKRLGRHVGRTLPACVANIIVFVIVGLWHGAEWHYIIWGAINGFIIALSDLCTPLFKRINETLRINVKSLPHRITGMVRTFIVVCFIRYFDAMSNPLDSLICLHNTFCNFMPVPFQTALELLGIQGAGIYGLSRLAVAGCIVVFATSVLEERGVDVREKLIALGGVKAVARLIVIVAMATLMVMALPYSLGGGGEFAYANF